jgi:2-keto-4-pentenoate hydratase
MQKMLSVDEPDFGHLFDDMILPSGGECRIRVSVLFLQKHTLRRKQV